MKSPDTYIDEVYEKYDETKKNNQKYKTVKMRPKISIVPISSVVICVMLSLFVIVKNGEYISNVEKDIDAEIKSETNTKMETAYMDILIADSPQKDEYIKKLIESSEYIAVISKFNDISVIYEFVGSKFILKTESTLNIDRILKGEITNSQDINCYKYGGEINVKTILNDQSINWKEWEKKYIGYELSESEIENGIFKQVVNDAIQLEEGKQYLVFMNYNEKKSAYEIFDMKYGIMELDVDTNKVKMTETGEFEDFDWDLIKNS